jgi:hypothetical protein
MRRSRLVAAAPLLVLSLVGCGTTVPASQQLSGPNGGGGLGLDGSVVGGGTGGAGGTGSSAVGSTGGAAGGSTGGAPGAGPGTSTTGGTSAGTTGTGVQVPGGVKDTTPVRIGFEVIKGGNELISAGFGTPVNFGNGRTEVSAIVEDINARGGLGGRRILPFFAEWDATSGSTGREASCRSLVEDSKVTFLVTVVNMSQSFASCAAKHKVPAINASIAAGDLTLYQQFGDFLFSPALMNLDRELRLVLETARASGQISTGTKVGVVVDGVEDPQSDRVYKRTVDPMLTRWGIPHESFTVVQQSDVSAAVLRFATDDVKVVVFVAPSGIIEILFMQTAEQQQYRPAYSMGDSTSTWFVSSTAPREQVKRITGAGSLPLANVDTSQYPTTPREKACLDLIRKKGENNAERHSSITATVYCEAIYAIKAVAERVAGPLTAASFRAAYATVGTGYQPLTTFRTDLANGRHDNAAAYRLMAWRDSCTCLSYTTPVTPLPA